MMDTPIRETILELLDPERPEKSICPTEVARQIAGKDEKKWRLLMKPIKAEASIMAKEGLLQIKRKGKIADPENFKGTYRLILNANHPT